MTSLHSSLPRGIPRLARPVALALLLWSCDGGNGWRNLPTGANLGDSGAPHVEIETPDSTQRVAILDSVYVRVRVTDDVGVDSVVLSGFSLRGSAALGTLVAVPRFATKVVSLSGTAGTRDLTIERYLLATPDSSAEQPIFIVVAARDSVGNVTSDTVRIGIGGPRVQIVDPVGTVDVRAGSQIRARIVAVFESPLSSLSLQLRPTGSAGVQDSVTIGFTGPVTSVDTTLVLAVPAGSSGTADLRAVVRTASNDSAVSAPVTVRFLPAAADGQAPSVRFRVSAPARAEIGDSVAITVVGIDSVRVDSVGVSIQASRRLPTGTISLNSLNLAGAGDSVVFRFSLRDLGVSEQSDTSTIELLSTAWAKDPARNCGAATVPNTLLSDPCVQVGATISVAGRTGARTDIVLVRGGTVRSGSGDLFVDLAADETGRRVFISNHSLNHLKILPFGDTAFSQQTVSVGSEPWGVALTRGRDSLLVANSGGTNISVVSLGSLTEARRIRPPDVRLFSFTYDVDTDSTNTVSEHDFSDRPQFIGQVANGQILYSTKPTSTRDPGTIRIIDAAKDTANERNRSSEIFADYATESEGKGIVVNALTAFRAEKVLLVQPRRSGSSGPDPALVQGSVREVAAQLDSLRALGLTDTKVLIDADIESIGLSDTTFVAISRDNSTIAFGEGAVDPARIFLFQSVGTTVVGTTRETEDLVGNAAERVVSLGLNGDGTLGVARGRRAYFFDDDLRLQGVVESGPPAGGAALNPESVDYRSGGPLHRGFVSGLTADGTAYVDVVDAFSFRTVKRIIIRDQLIGTLIAVPVATTDPAYANPFLLRVRLFGITRTGILQLGIRASDLTP